MVICSALVSVDFVGTRTFATLTPSGVSFVVLALVAAPLRAQSPDAAVPRGTEPATSTAAEPDDASARFARAETMYREGRYEEAIAVLEELIEDYPEPILYFNLGRANESSGRIEAAISAYDSYLEAAPDAPDRESVRDRIARLRQRQRPEPSPVPTPPVLPPSPAPRPIVAPWVVAGLGGAGLAVGATFAGLSRARSNDARNAPDQVTAKSEHDAARRHAVAANVAFGVGAALLVAGVIWGVTVVVKRRRGSARQPSARSRPWPRWANRRSLVGS